MDSARFLMLPQRDFVRHHVLRPQRHCDLSKSTIKASRVANRCSHMSRACKQSLGKLPWSLNLVRLKHL